MEVRNIQTCPAVAVTTFLRKFRTPAIIDPTIPGSAAAALPASRPRSRAKALSLLFTHSLTLLGFFGRVEEPPAAPPPVNEVMMVEMTSPNDVNTAVIFKPCSLKISFSFSSFAFLYSLSYSRKLGSQFFTILTDNLLPRGSLFIEISNDRFDFLLMYLQIGRIPNLGEFALFSVNMRYARPVWSVFPRNYPVLP